MTGIDHSRVAAAAQTAQREMRLYVRLLAALCLLVLLGVLLAAYAALQAQQQSEANARLLGALDRQAAADVLAAERSRRTAAEAVEQVLTEQQARDSIRDAEIRRLLDEVLRLVSAEVRDPGNREQPPPTLGPQPSPTPGPTFLPRSSSRPRVTRSPDRPTPTASPAGAPGPPRPGCLVPFLPICLPGG